MNLFTKQKQSHRLGEGTYSSGRGTDSGRGGGVIRGFGMDMCTLLYLKCVISKDLLYSTGNLAMCYVAAWMGGEFGGEWIHVYVWLSPFAVCLSYHSTVNWLYSNTK